MTFSLYLALGILSLSLGAFIACVVCVSGALIARQKYYKSRITFILLLLSVIIICTTFIVITDFRTVIGCIKCVSDVFYFVILLFGAGFLMAWLWKFFIPFFILCYVICSVFTGIILYSSFDNIKESFDITVAKNSIKLDEKKLNCNMSGKKSIVLESYTLPDNLLLPLPRVWYRFYGVTDTEKKGDKAQYKTIDYINSDYGIKNEYILDVKKKYEMYLFANKELKYIDLSSSEVYPILYHVKVEVKNNKITYVLQQTL